MTSSKLFTTKWMLASALAVLATAATADSPGPALTSAFSPNDHFTERDGAAIYHGICQGCHMPDGQGASGAGKYPALAKNGRLGAKIYPAITIINGRRAMPSFGNELDDEQIAAVVNFVRSNFGNSYTDDISPAEVKAVRPEKPVETAKPQ